MQNDDILSLSVDIGSEIIRSGGEISRARDTVTRINKAFDTSCEVFALPSIIIAQSSKHIQIRHIGTQEINLAELSRLNHLSRRICNKKSCEIKITKDMSYTRIQELISVCIATASFCIFFGGQIKDAILSAIIGIIITAFEKGRAELTIFSGNLIDAFISAVLSFVPSKLGANTQTDKIIIGTIMLLVPGLTVVSAMRDLMNGDLIAGLFELFEAIMSALAIAFGVAGAIWVMRHI